MGIKGSLFLGAEMIRDGGSLAVIFQCPDSCEYWLMLPIDGFGDSQPKYLAPVLLNRTTDIEMHIRPEDAKIYLYQLLSDASNERQRSIIENMISVVSEKILNDADTTK